MRAARLPGSYWKLWSSSAVSNLGDGVSMIAYPWLASLITRDGFWLGLVVLGGRLPWLVFSLPAGAVIDRVDRRRLIVASHLTSALLATVVAAVVFSAEPTAGRPPGPGPLLGFVIVAAFLLGTAEVLRDSAGQTILPALVAGGDLERANGWLWSAETVMNSFVGPPLAGVLISVSLAVPFLLDAGSFAVAAVLVALIGGRFARPRTSRPRTRLRADIKEGLVWLWRHPVLRPLALLLGIMNGMGALATATEVLYAQDVLGLDAAQFGLLATAGAAGAVLGALVAARVTAVIGKGPSLFVSIAGSGVGYAAIGLVPSVAVFWAMFAFTALVATLWNVITVSLRQRVIPDGMLGRVNSVYRFFGWGMISLGALLGGATVSLLEPVAGRDWALRLPFLIAGAVHLLALGYALPRVGTRQIETAEQAASATHA